MYVNKRTAVTEPQNFLAAAAVQWSERTDEETRPREGVDHLGANIKSPLQ